MDKNRGNKIALWILGFFFFVFLDTWTTIIAQDLSPLMYESNFLLTSLGVHDSFIELFAYKSIVFSIAVIVDHNIDYTDSKYISKRFKFYYAPLMFLIVGIIVCIHNIYTITFLF